MSLQFYFGPAGSGKSTKLNQDLIKWSLAEPDKRFFLIVPDQFSLHTQMELVKTHPQRGIMNIEVLSFGRLAHRIFSEVGRSRLTVLDEVGKSLIIRKIAGDIANDLPTIGKSLGKLGLVNEVKSVVSELMQYGITPTDLQMMIKHSAKRGALASKLAEIQRLYAAFLKYIADRYITGEETLDLLCAALPKSGLVKGSVVVFDGFTGFTPLQNRVIQEWMRLAERVVVSVLMGAEAVPDEEAQKEQSLFYLTAKMVQDLSRLAQEAGVARLADIYMREAFRWSEGSALAHLEKHLFRYPWQAYDGEVQDDTLVNTSLRGDELKEHVLSTRRRSNPDKPKIVSVSGLLRYARNDGIKVSESPSLLAEAREACQKIKELTSEEGLAYREIAIITGDMENYAPYLEREALKYDIPLYLDRTRGILLNPFTEYIRAALAVVSNNYDYDGVFHVLRSGFAEVAAGEGGFETRHYTGVMAESKKGALTVDEIDRLENYVIACGIRGKKQWHEPFTRRQPSWRGEEEIKEQLLSLNQTREKVVAAMFVPPVHGRPRTVAPTSDTTDSESTVGAVVNRPPTEPTVGATVPGRPPTADGQATEPTVGAVVNRPPTVAAIIEALYAFLVSSRAQQKLAAYEAAFTASGDLVKAKEYA
ncbi:MAG: hypothetical protein LBI54_04980, partial [Lachnospiraceae bacterium]|nr:hypothetical protein [Lachnospiraceae bacterium]